MNTKLLVGLACIILLGACTSPHPTVRRIERPPTAAGVAQHTAQVSAALARIERRQNTPEGRKAFRNLRAIWIDCVHAYREADAIFAAQGLIYDADYYRQRHQLLDIQLAGFRYLDT